MRSVARRQLSDQQIFIYCKLLSGRIGSRLMPKSAARTRRLTQEERTDLSDRRMLECAVRLIVERGISGTKLTDVGLHAGYSRGLAAMRFGTKASLLGRVARHVTANWITH